MSEKLLINVIQHTLDLEGIALSAEKIVIGIAKERGKYAARKCPINYCILYPDRHYVHTCDG